VDSPDLLQTASGLTGALTGGMSMWGMAASGLFSLVGIIYLRQGRAANDVNRILCGLALLAYPFFVTKTVYIVLVGAALTAAPYLMEKF